MKRSLNKKTIRVISAAAAMLLAFLAGGLFLRFPEWGHAPLELISAPESVTVHLIMPEREELITVQAGDHVTLPDADEVEHYTFIGWRGAYNGMEQRETVPVWQETYYAAVYAVALEREEHRPYLFPDARGLFRPNEALTRGEAARMFHALLAVPIYGEVGFPDVPQDDPCFEAAAALRSLGVVDGGFFHPEDAVTRAELFKMLAAFYPAGREQFSFADLSQSDERYPLFCTAAERGWLDNAAPLKADPDHLMTRAETASLMNRVLGRSADRTIKPGQIGVMPDVNSRHDAYWDMAEACVAHGWTAASEGERWTGCTTLDAVPEGLYLDGFDLYAIDENGRLVCGTNYHGFEFDEDGCYTCGDAEIDEMVRKLFSRVLDDTMDREEMLHAVFRYEVNNFAYLRRNYYKHMDTSWMLDEAHTMLATGKGNCYNFAGAFCVMARALGYDAHVYSGAIGNPDARHAWVDIEIDGQKYMFDPEIEYAIVHRESNADLYMMTESVARQYRYIR